MKLTRQTIGFLVAVAASLAANAISAFLLVRDPTSPFAWLAVVWFLALTLVALAMLYQRLRTGPLEYFAEEAAAYSTLATRIPRASHLRVVGLANTSIFYLFEHYLAFLKSQKDLEVLWLSPTSVRIIEMLEQSILRSASADLLKELDGRVDALPIPDSSKTQLHATLSDRQHPVRALIDASRSLWWDLHDKAAQENPASHLCFKAFRYDAMPSTKGWAIGKRYVLIGNYDTPGYGRYEPLSLFDSKLTPMHVEHFKQKIKWVMDMAVRERQRDFDDGATHTFESLRGSFYEVSGRKLVRETLRAVAVEPGATIIDVGTGSGVLAVHLADSDLRPREVIAVELNRERARGFESWLALQQSAARSKIRVIHGGVGSVELPMSDAVVSRHAFHEFEDVDQAMAAIHRSLRANGQLLLSDVTCPDATRSADFLNRVGALSNPQNRGYWSASDLRTCLEKHGFVVESAIEARDYRMNIRDYERRCRDDRQRDSVIRLVHFLRDAAEDIKKEFEIEGSTEFDLEMCLPETLFICRKRPT